MAPGHVGSVTAGVLASDPSFATSQLPDLWQVVSPLGLRVLI